MWNHLKTMALRAPAPSLYLDLEKKKMGLSFLLDKYYALCYIYYVDYFSN